MKKYPRSSAFIRVQPICLLLGMLVISLAACNAGTGAPPAPTPTPNTGLLSRSAPGRITANGVLLPARQVALSFGVEGFVESVAVEIGQNVEAGQAMAALDATALERDVRR
jgi:multidrug efflux pump subunit AcrA (membrane-fusion protein)